MRMTLGLLISFLVPWCLWADQAQPTTISYKILEPARLEPTRRYPLLLLLHGCKQTPDDILSITRMDQWVESRQVIVMAPEQTEARNPTRCWNWFAAENQTRTGAEVAGLMQILNEVMTVKPIDRTRIYVAGLSAGSGMTQILLSCFPDVFRAGLAHSGPPMAAAKNVVEALQLMKEGPKVSTSELATRAATCSGPSTTLPALLTVTGLNDRIVHPKNSESQWEVQQALALIRHPEWKSENPIVQESQGEVTGGDRFKVREMIWHGSLIEQLVQVEGMDHAWSGGAAGYPYSDGKGPDVVRLMWDFFARVAP